MLQDFMPALGGNARGVRDAGDDAFFDEQWCC
jgi:hypothetical protein